MFCSKRFQRAFYAPSVCSRLCCSRCCCSCCHCFVGFCRLAGRLLVSLFILLLLNIGARSLQRGRRPPSSSPAPPALVSFHDNCFRDNTRTSTNYPQQHRRSCRAITCRPLYENKKITETAPTEAHGLPDVDGADGLRYGGPHHRRRARPRVRGPGARSARDCGRLPPARGVTRTLLL